MILKDLCCCVWGRDGWEFLFSALFFLYFGSKVFSDQEASKRLGTSGSAREERCKRVMNKERGDVNIWERVVITASL